MTHWRRQQGGAPVKMLDVIKYDKKVRRKYNSERAPTILSYDKDEIDALENMLNLVLELEYILIPNRENTSFVSLPREQYMSEWIN